MALVLGDPIGRFGGVVHICEGETPFIGEATSPLVVPGTELDLGDGQWMVAVAMETASSSSSRRAGIFIDEVAELRSNNELDMCQIVTGPALVAAAFQRPSGGNVNQNTVSSCTLVASKLN